MPGYKLAEMTLIRAPAVLTVKTIKHSLNRYLCCCGLLYQAFHLNLQFDWNAVRHRANPVSCRIPSNCFASFQNLICCSEDLLCGLFRNRALSTMLEPLLNVATTIVRTLETKSLAAQEG